MRELTVPDLTDAVSRMRSDGDPVNTLVASKQLRIRALKETVATHEAELRVIECFARIKDDWRTLPCRSKLRHVLGHGVAFAPAELAALLGHKLNTVRSTLMRMRLRGEAARVGHGRWVKP